MSAFLRMFVLIQTCMSFSNFFIVLAFIARPAWDFHFRISAAARIWSSRFRRNRLLIDGGVGMSIEKVIFRVYHFLVFDV